MRAPWGPGALAAVAIALLPARAAAQARPYDPAVDIQMFQWALGPKTFFSVSDADTGDRGELALDVAMTYISNPFAVDHVGSVDHSDVVHQAVGAQVAAAYDVTRWLQLGVALPFVLDLRGDDFDMATREPADGGLVVRGLGDLRLEVKALAWQHGHVRVGALVGGTLATSRGTDNAQFIGDNSPTARGKLTVEWDRGHLTLGANAGGVVRSTRDIYNVRVGSVLVWGVAAAYRLTDHFALIGEGFGQTGPSLFTTDESPIELVGGLRVYATPSVAVSAGGGAGVTPGFGSPQAQLFFAVGYAPDVRDSDGDGIPNSRDRCPLVPEDKDGFQDEDGCPEDDNDGDRRPDVTDKCPNEPEDLDGFQDDDGCPDPDNDHDGILDAADKCPDEPEDGLPPYPKDGCPATRRDSDGDGLSDAVDKCPLEEEDFDQFEDGDGCPDLDNDHDGVPDAVDKCPLCPEDKDGFEDDDGCPDLDNDRDGIPDARDKCPDAPETVNGFEDEDGCPDAGGQNLVRLDEDLLVVDKAPALAGGKLTPAGLGVVRQMALVMAGHHEVTAWLIAVAQPSAAAAKQLGAAIQAELVAGGVAAGITVVDKVGPAKIAGVVKERGEPGPFVCPAGLEVHERPEAAAPR